MTDTISRELADQVNRNPDSKWDAVQVDKSQYRLMRRRRSGRRDFNAAMVNRLTADWPTVQRSSDEILRYQLQRLISRSRDLERNNEYVNGFLHQAERNVIGESGVMLNMHIREPDLRGGFKVDTAAGDAIERAWKDFSKPKNFLISGDMSQCDVQRLVLRSILRDGGVVGRKIVGKEAGNKYLYSIQLLEIDHLDTDFNSRFGQNEVRMGVEIDGFGRTVAYHLLNDHPGETGYTHRRAGKKYMRVEADEIIHPFVRHRIGQTRGYPWLSSSMAGLQMLLGYKEAELVASRAAASIGHFLRDPEGTGNPLEDTGDDHPDPYSIEAMEPGGSRYIGNLQVESYNPQHPMSQFGDFMKEALRGVAVGLGISHHNLSGDMAGVNYSSARIAELAERDQWKLLQRWFSDAWMGPIFDDWLNWALLSGEVRLPSGTPLPVSKYEKFNQPVWRGRRWQWVDPLKEVNAAEKALANNLTSHRKLIAENGGDEEDLYAEIKQGKELREAMGLGAPQPQPEQVDNNANGNDEDDD